MIIREICVMKIFLAQQNYHIGNFESNTKKIIQAIDDAKVQGGDLIVFSEQSVCGYPARDFLEFNDFINKLRLEYLEKNFDPEWEKLTLEGIGNEVGFSSRTTFYNSIKKYRGVSPSAFFESRKKNQTTI